MSQEGLHAILRTLPLLQAIDGNLSLVPAPTGAQSASLEHALRCFTPSEVMLYDLAKKDHWTETELGRVIALVRHPQFKGRDIGPDLISRVRLD